MPPVPGLRGRDVAQPPLELRRDQVVGPEVEGGAQHAREARPPRPGDRAPLLNLTVHLWSRKILSTNKCTVVFIERALEANKDPPHSL